MFALWIVSDIVESNVPMTWAATSGACLVVDILPCLHLQATYICCAVRTLRFGSGCLEEYCRDIAVV